MQQVLVTPTESDLFRPSAYYQPTPQYNSLVSNNALRIPALVLSIIGIVLDILLIVGNFLMIITLEIAPENDPVDFPLGWNKAAFVTLLMILSGLYACLFFGWNIFSLLMILANYSFSGPRGVCLRILCSIYLILAYALGTVYVVLVTFFTILLMLSHS